MKTRALLIPALCLTLNLSADQTDYAAGSLAAPWLGISNDPRASAMVAGVAQPEGLGALQENVAGLAAVKGWELQAGHTIWVQDVAMEHLGLGWGRKGTGLALGFDYLGMGSVDSYKVSAGQISAAGSLKPSASTLSLGVGQDLRHGLALGVSGKWIQQNLDGTKASSTFAGDFGLTWAFGKSGVSLGAAAQNVGGQLDGASLPGQLKAGLGYRIPMGNYPLSLAADYVQSLAASDGSANAINVGTELRMHQLLALRAGYSMAQRGSLGGAAGLSAGLELAYAGWTLGYAFTGLGDLGSGQQVGLGLGW